MLHRKIGEHGAIEPFRFILLIAAFVAFGFPRPSSSAAREDLIEAAKKDRELVLYTTINVEEANTMSRHFKAKYPFLDVKIGRADAERIMTKVLTETSGKKYLVDVIQTPAFYLHSLKKRGIMGEYSSTEDRFYPRNFKEERYWTATYYNPYVVAYNTKLVSPQSIPKRYEDLLNPVWKNKMALEQDKIDWFTAMLEILGREKGLKYMRDLSRQNPMLRVGQSLIAQLVAAGEALLQINGNAVSVNRLKQRGAPIDWIAPGRVPGLMVGIGLTAQAPHPNAARLFIDFALSKEGQQLYQSAGRLVARSDLFQEETMKLKGAQIVPVDPAWAEKFDEDSKLLAEIFSR
ncbi:MAG: extracellular solute-binding protein [Deltaproteobacteria bacterium]|nr:extracellular solute-binding protein [Deltaproteobacteria bacterium]